jgi:hypothetical protein
MSFLAGDSGVMLKATKSWVVFTAIGCLCASGCGGGKKEAAVVRVGSNSIAAATVDHWIRVESVTAHGGARAESQPKGALPVPPEYTDCVAYLVSQPQGGAPKPTPEEARVKCAAEYKQFKETILNVLISYYWDVEEAAAKGIHVTDAEVTHYIKGVYPHPGEFAKFLKATHETLADERLLVRGKLTKLKLVALSERNTHTQAERVRAITKAISEEAARWTPRTSCDPGYVVPQCKQHGGPQV